MSSCSASAVWQADGDPDCLEGSVLTSVRHQHQPRSMVLTFDEAWTDLQGVWVGPCLESAALCPPSEHKASTQDLVVAYT